MKLPRSLGREDFQPVLTGNDVHIVPIGDGEYSIGTTVKFAEVGEAALLEEVRQRAIAFCPTLAAGEIVRTWSGKRPRPEGRPTPATAEIVREAIGG